MSDSVRAAVRELLQKAVEGAQREGLLPAVPDAGNQVAMLALSVWARYMEAAREADAEVPIVVFPENGYRGDYIRIIARELLARDGTRWIGTDSPADIEPIRRFAVASCLAMIRATLARFEVDFDVWQSERELHEAGEVKATFAVLDKAGFIDRRDNAVWLRTTALWGDEKDRVVVKSDGLPTYLPRRPRRPKEPSCLAEE
jgi:arginyl-tRNA synthetase